eukprot:2573740-Prymnesium_polylepis.1
MTGGSSRARTMRSGASARALCCAARARCVRAFACCVLRVRALRACVREGVCVLCAREGACVLRVRGWRSIAKGWGSIAQRRG